jgi:hypothetical protein
MVKLYIGAGIQELLQGPLRVGPGLGIGAGPHHQITDRIGLQIAVFDRQVGIVPAGLGDGRCGQLAGHGMDAERAGIDVEQFHGNLRSRTDAD